MGFVVALFEHIFELFVLDILGAEEECFESKVMEQSSICFTVGLGLNIHANRWGYSEFVSYPIVAQVELSYDVFKVGETLIIFNPASHTKVNLSVLNKLLELLLVAF